ncbi:uncharacterized protein VTP21DRAFT_10619 [Calcarisporiella thermophila]|uniref:uncharacterized protein n=1 Tax=Calcarisporiella thermophila TaxID=911321 RepID=UPI0037429418
MTTTIHRKVLTHLSDFRRALKLWSDLNGDGLTVANVLMNARLEERFVDHSDCWHPSLIDFENLKEKYEEKMVERVQELKGNLEAILEKMRQQYLKIQTQVLRLEEARIRACELYGQEFVYERPLFRTCTLDKIAIYTQQIFSNYTRELELKQSLVAKLANITEQEVGTVLLSAWLNQPFLDTSLEREFEELIEVETNPISPSAAGPET